MSKKTYNEQQEQEITRLYRQGKTMTELAAIYGGKHHTVSKMLHRLGEPTKGVHHKLMTGEMRQDIISSYPKESQDKIARRLGIRQGRVSRIVRAAGIYDLWHLHGGKEHKNWKGGRITRGNYLFVLVSPDDPYRIMAGDNPYILEHRLVMAKHLGRPLGSKETVHHINGDRSDNRIENLQLRQKAHGKGVIAECGDCGSKNIIHGNL